MGQFQSSNVIALARDSSACYMIITSPLKIKWNIYDESILLGAHAMLEDKWNANTYFFCEKPNVKSREIQAVDGQLHINTAKRLHDFIAGKAYNLPSDLTGFTAKIIELFGFYSSIKRLGGDIAKDKEYSDDNIMRKRANDDLKIVKEILKKVDFKIIKPMFDNVNKE
jgi:hypothetical protein